MTPSVLAADIAGCKRPLGVLCMAMPGCRPIRLDPARSAGKTPGVFIEAALMPEAELFTRERIPVGAGLDRRRVGVAWVERGEGINGCRAGSQAARTLSRPRAGDSSYARCSRRR